MTVQQEAKQAVYAMCGKLSLEGLQDLAVQMFHGESAEERFIWVAAMNEIEDRMGEGFEAWAETLHG